MAVPDYPEKQPVTNVIAPTPELNFVKSDKMPEHRMMAEAVEQVAATAAVTDQKRAPSMWMLVIAFILALFMLGMFLLAAVASAPGGS